MSFSSEQVVTVKDATIYQDNRLILSDVGFEIEKGEFVYLIGRTGGGKSSLLKTLYADIPLKRGEAEVAGFDIKKLKKSQVHLLRRKLGIVFQDFQLLPDRTVSENLMFVMRATGWKEKSKMKNRIAEVLMQVGLGSVDTKMPYQLSGGEQQRVVIARALINEPLILLADEPTGNLDPEVSQDIFEIFQQINKSGTAILMATHDYNLIKGATTRVMKCENQQLMDSQVEQFDHSSPSQYS